MEYDRFNPHVRRAVRRGIAPLEFVMALPFLSLLMVAMTWLGYSVIGQTEVLIEARTNAWKKRFTNASDDPLIFPADLVVSDASLYSRDKDFVTEEATKKIKVSPMFDGLPGPAATHTILAGSWDHEAMKLDKPPNEKLLAIAAASGTAGKVQSWASKLSNPLGELQNLGSQILATQNSDSQSIENQSQQSGADTGEGSQTRDQAEEKTKQDRAAEKAKLEARKQELGGFYNPVYNRIDYLDPGELKRTDDERDKAAAELLRLITKTEPDEEKEKQRKAEVARLERKVDLLDGKIKRLESEFMDVEADIKALED